MDGADDKMMVKQLFLLVCILEMSLCGKNSDKLHGVYLGFLGRTSYNRIMNGGL